MKTELLKRGGWSMAIGSLLSTSLVALVLLAGGCDNDRLPDHYRKSTEISALPDAVRKAAEQALPGVTFSDAWQNMNSRTRRSTLTRSAAATRMARSAKCESQPRARSLSLSECASLND